MDEDLKGRNKGDATLFRETRNKGDATLFKENLPRVTGWDEMSDVGAEL